MNGPLEGPGRNSGENTGTSPQKITQRSRTRGAWHGRADWRSRKRDSDFRAAFNAARLAMAIVDRDGRVVSANDALGTLLGAAPETLVSTSVTDLPALGLDGGMLRRGLDGGALRYPVAPRSGEDGAGGATGTAGSARTAGSGAAAGVRGTPPVRCTRRLKNADGHTLWAEISLLPTAHDGETLLSVADVSEQRDLRDRLRHLQMHDPVTRLPNRSLFFERLAAALSDTATGRVGICYLDLDGFKAVNDTLGHRMGDELLDAVARRLVQCAEDGGQRHLAARLGGDEFAILVDGSTGTRQLTALADAVLKILQRPFDLGGRRLTVSASIGVVEREAQGTDATELMQAADTTLYWAKADGRARWTLFDPERNASRMTRQALSSALPGAVERSEFVLDYQPIVDLGDDRLVGVEALVRWQHPQFGKLGPNRFIGLAEENGAIVPLGRWVLEESCRQARRWMLAHPGPPVYVSVNVAVRQVWDSDLVADVRRVLEETGLPSGLLQLELTESDVMGSAGRPLEALQALSEMGVRIAIDDFGTGYSNLAYLSRLPVRVLKLDGSFVRGFSAARHPNPADETIVTALVRLAHQLGLTVTAECVEGSEQADRLRGIGCDTGQGYHYAKPMPAHCIGALLR
ncbi:PAS domain S-box-containing protein/diguanylate cyclase (GGDEF)-like protein [Streptomyces sp. Amel2xB2]|nr:EAL domain-containing protein [Streptomyces sp. Amel2xB2]RAJ69762.1 PAS domain S-box-containing protein/diguanylate cyclase (GGDEF)-like protein [Streptomyces sp. Amel2xB2]